MNNVVSKLDSIFLQYKERKQFLEKAVQLLYTKEAAGWINYDLRILVYDFESITSNINQKSTIVSPKF
jgi:hypothetical protein